MATRRFKTISTLKTGDAWSLEFFGQGQVAKLSVRLNHIAPRREREAQ